MLPGYMNAERLASGLRIIIDPKAAYNELGELLLGTGVREYNAENRAMIESAVSGELEKGASCKLGNTTQGGRVTMWIYGLRENVDPSPNVHKGMQCYLSKKVEKLNKAAKKMGLDAEF